MAKAPSKQTSAGALGETVSVVGPAQGRRRANIHFGPKAIDLDLSQITPEQLAAIEADPVLHISRGTKVSAEA